MMKKIHTSGSDRKREGEIAAVHTKRGKQVKRLTMKSRTFEIVRSESEPERESCGYSCEYYALLFMQSGNGAWIVQEKEYLLTAGDVLLMGPEEVFQVPQEQNPAACSWIVLRIDREFLRKINLAEHDLSMCFDSSRPDHGYVLHLDGVNREMLTYLLNLIDRERVSGEYAAEMYCVGGLLQILSILNRLAYAAAREPDTRSGVDSVVYRVLEYINNHYMEDLNLDFLANRFFVSKYHLSRGFTNLVGSSVHQYIIQKRLDMAKQMMSAGIPISEVYQHCGFGDYSNFYRAFRGKYRISPREYVENLKKETARRKNG